MSKRIGVVGFGNLGKFLVSSILKDERYELAFVWNRTKDKLKGNIDSDLILDVLDDFAVKRPDIIIEVAHPCITKTHGKVFLNYCDYMIGSPTALSDCNLFSEIKDAAVNHGLYVPSGAFWGGEDIKKMSDAGVLKALTVTMRKHPLSLKLEGYLKEKNAEVTNDAVILYHGSVRDICALAPHNTNTMAVAAIAAQSLGFDNVIGCLVSDPCLTNCHIVEIEAYGFPKEGGSCFHVHTIRKNPAVIGEVTGEATYAAYFGSLKRAGGKGPGMHLC